MCSGVFLCSFSTRIVTLVVIVVIANAGICLVFLISNEIKKMFLKTMETKKKKHRKTGRSKLNCTEKIISKSLIDFYVIHNEFTQAIDQKQNYFRLKESIRSKDDPLGDIEGYRLIEHHKEVRMN